MNMSALGNPNNWDWLIEMCARLIAVVTLGFIVWVLGVIF